MPTCSESGALMSRRSEILWRKSHPETAREGCMLSRPPPSFARIRLRGQKSSICEPDGSDAAGWLRKASYLPRSAFPRFGLLRAAPPIGVFCPRRVDSDSNEGPRGSCPGLRLGSHPDLRCIKGRRRDLPPASLIFLLDAPSQLSSSPAHPSPTDRAPSGGRW